MHDVVVLYNHPENTESFDEHYRRSHAPKTRQLSDLLEFTWGRASSESGSSPYYVIARMAFADAATAAASFASPSGVAAIEDLGHFAGAGVTVLHVPRESSDADVADGITR